MCIKRGEDQVNTINLQQMFCYDSSPLLMNYDLFITLKLRAAAPVRTRISDEINFLLCQSCFWCASYFNYSEVVPRCPACDSINIESLPISNSEFYTFSHDRNRGVTLEFSENRELS
jgi:hypothetical protein